MRRFPFLLCFAFAVAFCAVPSPAQARTTPPTERAGAAGIPMLPPLMTAASSAAAKERIIA